MQKLIQGIEIRKLDKHADERGFLCELLRKDWNILEEFTMAYFPTTYPDVVRAWHRHSKTKQIDNMCIIQGNAKIVVYDDRPNSPTKGTINEFIIGEDNLALIKIPGECWHGSKALGTKHAILINFPNDIIHHENPDEETLPPDTTKIPHDWKRPRCLHHG